MFPLNLVRIVIVLAFGLQRLSPQFFYPPVRKDTLPQGGLHSGLRYGGPLSRPSPDVLDEPIINAGQMMKNVIERKAVESNTESMNSIPK